MNTTPSILVVEDDATRSQSTQEFLTRSNYQIFGRATSGEQALELIGKDRPDLILMEIQLSGALDGIEAGKILWEKFKLPTIFLTAYADETTLKKAQLSHPYGYLIKPFEDLELKAAIDIALNRYQDCSYSCDTDGLVDSTSLGEKQLTPLEFLSRVDPFRKLPKPELEQLAKEAHFYEIEEDDSLIKEEQILSEPFILTEGRLVAIKSSAQGKEFAIDILAPGDILGVALACSATPSTCSIVSQTPSKVLRFSLASLTQLLDGHPEIYQGIFMYTWEKLRRSSDMLEILAHEKVEYRIAYILTELLVDFWKRQPQTDSYQIEITRQQLSELSGTTPETAIRVTKAMEREGLLDLTKVGVITLKDIKGLQALCSCSDDS